jgi:hypothetical protein
MECFFDRIYGVANYVHISIKHLSIQNRQGKYTLFEEKRTQWKETF